MIKNGVAIMGEQRIIIETRDGKRLPVIKTGRNDKDDVVLVVDDKEIVFECKDFSIHEADDKYFIYTDSEIRANITAVGRGYRLEDVWIMKGDEDE